MTFAGRALNKPELIGDRVRGHLGDQHAPLVRRALADQTFAQLRTVCAMAIVAVVRHRPRAARAPAVSSLLHLVDHAVLRVDQRRQFGEQHPADGGQIALALQHAGELAPGWS